MDLTVPPPLSLPAPGTVQVWQLRCSTISPLQSRWGTWLAPAERDRLQRYRQPGDRDRFVTSRGGLRYLLASYLGTVPTAIQLGYSHWGRPQLLQPAAELHFNVAHSGDWVIFGFSRCPYIGVDVEILQPRQRLSRLIQHCLTAAEQAHLPSEPAAQLTDFFSYWTIKEAHLKAVGLGLSYPLQRVQVALHPTPRLVTTAPVVGHADSRWDVQLWQPDAGAIAAVCVGQSPSSCQITTLAAPL